MSQLLKRLVIDTATKFIFLSLIEGENEVQTVYQEGYNDHSVTIIPLIQSMMTNQGWKLNELDEIIVGIGPGSYTGVRIGVSIAKMLGYLNNTKVYTVSSLLLLSTTSNHEYIIPMIDARRKNAFLCKVHQVNHRLEVIVDERLVEIEAFQDQYGENAEIVIEGRPIVSKILINKLYNPVEDIHSLTPNYLQITEAERNLHIQ